MKAILEAVDIPVQLGGGIRDIGAVEAWLAAGISRVILGSAAAKNPGLVIEAAKKFPGRVVVGIDAKGGMVATEGWAETSSLKATELAQRLENVGISAIIYTDIARDGMKTGLNLEETTALATCRQPADHRLRRRRRDRRYSRLESSGAGAKKPRRNDPRPRFV